MNDLLLERPGIGLEAPEGTKKRPGFLEGKTDGPQKKLRAAAGGQAPLSHPRKRAEKKKSGLVDFGVLVAGAGRLEQALDDDEPPFDEAEIGHAVEAHAERADEVQNLLARGGVEDERHGIIILPSRCSGHECAAERDEKKTRGFVIKPQDLRLLLAFLPIISLGACEKPGSGRPAQATFRVALLTPGPISDAGWNAGAFEGLKAIQNEKELGASVSHVQVKSPSEFEEQFRAYAAQGYTLCFGHGFEFQDAAARVAKEYPKTFFVTTSGSRTAPNLAPIVFELEQAAYLCGLVSGRMSKSGKAGMVGGVELPSIKSTFLAFEGGLKAGNPKASATAVFTGSFEDVAGAKTAALALADQGCDFLFQNADAAALGVFRAATERGIRAFGTNKDQNALAPSVLASAVIDMPRAFVETARRVKEGRFDGQPIRYGLKSGVISFVWSPVALAKVPPAVVDEVKAVAAKIESGELVVPRGNF